jgi:two-component system, cell cycle sensor histidine kinase and response regulator CckA
METLLVVDDDQWVRELAGNILRAEGYRVLEASDGPTALRMAKTHSGPIDLLLADVMMPEMTGRQLADQLHVAHPGMKVLFMSAYAPEAVADAGVRATDPFIAKPFTIDYLARKVRDVLGPRRT